MTLKPYFKIVNQDGTVGGKGPARLELAPKPPLLEEDFVEVEPPGRLIHLDVGMRQRKEVALGVTRCAVAQLQEA